MGNADDDPRTTAGGDTDDDAFSDEELDDDDIDDDDVEEADIEESDVMRRSQPDR